jgi:hypothetical protein
MPDMIVMRLADMKRVHPDQIEARCAKCNEMVAVYPSGQKAMRLIPDIRLVCQVCRDPADVTVLAPGALQEPSQSQRKQ